MAGSQIFYIGGLLAIFFRSMENRNLFVKRTSAGVFYRDLAFVDDSEFLELDPEETVPFEEKNVSNEQIKFDI